MLIETTENDGLTLSPTLSSCFVCMSPCLPAPLNLRPYGVIQIRLLLLLLLYSGTQFPGKEKKYAMQLQKVQKSTWNEPYSSSFTIIIMYIFFNFFTPGIV